MNDVTILTETWTKNTPNTNDVLQDYEDRTNYAIIRKDSEDLRGGGVAISYNKNKIQMTRARLPASKFEVVAAIGRRTGQRRKVCVVAVYIPPWYHVNRAKKCLEYVNDCLALLSNRYADPYFFVGGDFNKKDARKATRDFPLIRAIATPPTRGTSVLDIISTNALDTMLDSGVTRPIHNAQNVESDHLVVFASFRMLRVQPYNVHSYRYRHVTDAGILKFGDWIDNQSWDSLNDEVSPSKQVAEFHRVLEEGLTEMF